MARKNIIITGDYTGDIAETVITGSSGTVALHGDIYIGESVHDDQSAAGNTYSGDGVTVIKGGNTGGVSRTFGRRS
ncbi:hypothetical protein SRB5_51750 [Streptomyces sp. RB5]|uniref:Uncharacterized protein n=1 Tax=Streptomyces smaragdinus TaxID=2585196 RepID=A0A7K0CNE2_9ACTN|nr:hypothetical protein [Streptomyces smaragdinus]MQY14998.1 hypothetical protein [Streptomyces smaragdinus]